MLCKSYDRGKCEGTECTTTTATCSSCYALWERVSGVNQIVKLGCWSQCDAGEKCIGSAAKNKNHGGLIFCCCTGENCNNVTNSTAGWLSTLLSLIVKFQRIFDTSIIFSDIFYPFLSFHLILPHFIILPL